MRCWSRHERWHDCENGGGNFRRRNSYFSDFGSCHSKASVELAMAFLVRENGQEKSGTSEDRKIKSSRCREVSPTKSGICRIPELSNFWLKVPSDPRKEVGPRKRFPFLEQPWQWWGRWHDSICPGKGDCRLEKRKNTVHFFLYSLSSGLSKFDKSPFLTTGRKNDNQNFSWMLATELRLLLACSKKGIDHNTK